MVNKQCPNCKNIVSLAQSQWDLGAELPKDCPYCNKPIKKEEDETREYPLKDSEPYAHKLQIKGTYCARI
ncbi:MAG: hypothetical protein P8X91_00165 [Candidatus Bathyarchaeota archaeon]